jgi:hypothetical protein
MSITSANAILTLSQATLFPTPVQLQGFAADDIYDMPAVQTVEELMGVDGVLSFGFIFTPRVQNIALQADSLSISFFDTIAQQQIAAKDVYVLNGVIRLTSVGTQYTMSNGALRNYAPIPDAKRVLQPRRFTIVWNTVAPGPT